MPSFVWLLPETNTEQQLYELASTFAAFKEYEKCMYVRILTEQREIQETEKLWDGIQKTENGKLQTENHK